MALPRPGIGDTRTKTATTLVQIFRQPTIDRLQNGVPTMRVPLLCSVFLTTLGCGAKPPAVQPPLPCTVRIMALDGSPFGEHPRSPGVNGLVPIFVELEIESVHLEGIDLAGRTVQERQHWHLDVCIVDQVGPTEQLQMQVFLQYDDPEIQSFVPEELRQQSAVTARPETFNSRHANVAYFFGFIDSSKLVGPKRMLLRLFPTADKRTAIPTSCSWGVPVPLQYFDAEFRPVAE